MPKQLVNPHFDADALVLSVHEQDLGLRISTNNVEGFRQILYRAAHKLGKPIHVYTYPKRPKSLALLKESIK